MDVKLRILLLCLVLLTPIKAFAQTIEIVSRNIPDVYRLELAEGEKATITVWLKSSGDPLDGYTVQLWTMSKGSPAVIAEKISDAQGVIFFRGMGSGRYLIVLKRTDKPQLTVDLGDMRLSRESVKGSL